MISFVGKQLSFPFDSGVFSFVLVYKTNPLVKPLSWMARLFIHKRRFSDYIFQSYGQPGLQVPTWNLTRIMYSRLPYTCLYMTEKSLKTVFTRLVLREQEVKKASSLFVCRCMKRNTSYLHSVSLIIDS